MSHSLTYHELRDLYRDGLTQLANRNALVKDISATSYDTLALVDIDKFSVLNDLHGEDNGNKILIEFKNRLLEYFPQSKYKLFRVGADKFVALAKNCEKAKEELEPLCEGLIKNIAAKGIIIDDNFIDINITIGLAYADDTHAYEYAQRVVNYARRNFISFMKYDTEIFDTKEDFAENIHWIKKLKDGMLNGNFKAYFQPIVNLNTHEIYKYESLVRYEDDDGTLVSPGIFLPIAKKAKLFPSVMRVMLRDVIEIIAQKKVRVAVNVSFDDLRDKDTYDFIIFTLMMNPEEAKLLDFEILESEEIKDFELVKKFISEIRSFGCSIGVDDFGAGFSNFNMLEALKVDFVKIDGSLINSIDTNKTQEVIVETIAGFAKKTGIKTIAEFVATEPIYEKVKNLDIDYGQGYYFDQALPASKVEKSNVLGESELF